MTLRLAALASLAVLAACASGPQRPQQAERRECSKAPVQVTNASGQAVEQLYLGAPGAWGRDLLAGNELAPRAVLNLPRPGEGRFNLRLVWVNGRAAEFPNLDGCITTRVELGDAGMRAQ
jgi:hypothetical protein